MRFLHRNPPFLVDYVVKTRLIHPTSNPFFISRHLLSRRSREYLTENEIDRLRKSAKMRDRHGVRNDLIILLMFRHALRVGELDMALVMI